MELAPLSGYLCHLPSTRMEQCRNLAVIYPGVCLLGRHRNVGVRAAAQLRRGAGMEKKKSSGRPYPAVPCLHLGPSPDICLAPCLPPK